MSTGYLIYLWFFRVTWLLLCFSNYEPCYYTQLPILFFSSTSISFIQHEHDQWHYLPISDDNAILLSLILTTFLSSTNQYFISVFNSSGTSVTTTSGNLPVRYFHKFTNTSTKIRKESLVSNLYCLIIWWQN